MFENIIGQPGAVSELRRGIEASNLPGALLFYGPPLTGKLTAALELARVLMCTESADWNCSCRACTTNRILENPYLLTLGSRTFIDEIQASADTLRRTRQPAARFLFIRAVRKLTRRFDRILWEDVEAKLASVRGSLEEIEELLTDFYPDAILPEDKVLNKKTERIFELAEKAGKLISSANIPIHQIRKVSYWSHTTAADSRKVIILENADRMGDGPRNGLLKILEEPPSDTYFILLISRRENILPTLSSRLRAIAFLERTGEMDREILRRVYKEESDEYGNLDDFFLAWRTNPDSLRNACERFMESVKKGDPGMFFSGIGADSGDHGAPAFLKELEDHATFNAFLMELAQTGNRMYRKQLGENTISSQELVRYEKWNNALRRQLVRMEKLNMSPRLLTEALFSEMSGAI
ncbi:MAG: DNA polymerase III [Spirochaetales bacterium]|jgi:DNA polymerase III delta prime subunit|nr:DNA polymerase III [Spirochaetales bacterium]